MGTCENLWELCGNLRKLAEACRNLWELIGIYVRVFCVATRFYIVGSRCKSILHCVFLSSVVFALRVSLQVVFTLCVFAASRFLVVYFTPQGVFSLCILHCRAFFRCVFHAVLRFSAIFYCISWAKACTPRAKAYIFRTKTNIFWATICACLPSRRVYFTALVFS